jgi:formamidopyrimidine-DNA glycosylase
MKRCFEGLRLWLAWQNAAASSLALYSQSAGLTGKELLEAQEENTDYQTTFQKYKAHLKACAECQQAIRQIAG